MVNSWKKNKIEVRNNVIKVALYPMCNLFLWIQDYSLKNNFQILKKIIVKLL
jgi:hypothetical protein